MKQTFKNIINHKLFKNSIFLYLLTFSNYFIGLLLYPYLSRVLSMENFGLVGFSMSFVLIFQSIVEFGFIIDTTAKISKSREDKEEVSKIVSTTMLSKIILAFISLVLFSISALFITNVKNNFMFILIFLLSSIFTAMLPDFLFRGIEQMKIVTVRTIITKLISIIFAIILVKGDEQIMFVPISLLIGNVISLLISLKISKNMGYSITIKLENIKQSIINIKESCLFFLSRIAVSINQSIGSVFLGLKFLPTSIEMGIFSGAYRLSSAADMLSPPIIDSIYPHMINKKDYKLFKKVLIYGSVLWGTFISVAIIFSKLICVIILGNEYASASDYLRVLLLGSLFAFPNTMFGYVALSPIGKAKHANISLLISTTTSVVYCLILWACNAISVLNICLIILLSNVVSLGYRGLIFYKNRKLIITKEK